MADDGQFTLDDVLGTSNPETGTTDPSIPPGMSHPETGMQNPGVSPPCPPGHDTPRNGQPVPQVAGGDLPWAFDWSTTRKVAAVDPRGGSYRFETLAELIRYIARHDPGATVVGESTFESYDVDRRTDVIGLAESLGVVLLTVPARGNTWRRLAAGLPEKTSQSRRTDVEDALAIQRAAANGAHLKRPAPVDPVWADLRAAAAQRFVKLRRSGGKDGYALDLMRHLPPYTLQPTDRKIALGPVNSYSPIIVAAVGVAAEFVSSRDGFERLTGICSHGYPSQFRSDLYHWGWTDRKRERITLSVYRRELRWLFHQLKETR